MRGQVNCRHCRYSHLSLSLSLSPSLSLSLSHSLLHNITVSRPSVVVRGHQKEPTFSRRLRAVALSGGSVFLLFVGVWFVIGK